MRRLIAAVVIVVILAAAWSGGWYALAGYAEQNIVTVLDKVKERGIDIDCRNRDLVGFPFAMKIDCGATTIAEERTGSRAELGGLSGGASIFAPRTAEVSLASPAHVDSPLMPGPADMNWQDAAIKVGIGMNGPRAVSFDTSGFKASVPAGNVSAARAEGTLSPAADGGTDAAGSFTGLAVTIGETAFPPFDGDVSGWLSLPPRALMSGRAGLHAPLSARIVNARLKSGAATLGATGDLSVDKDGIVDGTIKLSLAGAEALPAFIAALPPERQKLANAAAGGIMAFGQPTTIDGRPATELTVEIVRGEAQVGPAKVHVPRLPL